MRQEKGHLSRMSMSAIQNLLSEVVQGMNASSSTNVRNNLQLIV